MKAEGRMQNAERRADGAERPSFWRSVLGILRRRSGGERGQALVEYAIVFPIQLIMTLGIIQLAHIFIGQQVVEYAAFCGARAKLVGLSDAEAQRAVWIPLSGVCDGDSNKDSACGIQLPGWGSRTMSNALYQTLLQSAPAGPLGDAQRAQLTTDYNGQQFQTSYLSGCGNASDSSITPFNGLDTNPLPGVCWKVVHNYKLRVPVGNYLAWQFGKIFFGADSNYLVLMNGQWYMQLTASCVLANPAAQ